MSRKLRRGCISQCVAPGIADPGDQRLVRDTLVADADLAAITDRDGQVAGILRGTGDLGLAPRSAGGLRQHQQPDSAREAVGIVEEVQRGKHHVTAGVRWTRGSPTWAPGHTDLQGARCDTPTRQICVYAALPPRANGATLS